MVEGMVLGFRLLAFRVQEMSWVAPLKNALYRCEGQGLGNGARRGNFYSGFRGLGSGV